MNLTFIWEQKAEMNDLERLFNNSFSPWWDHVNSHINKLKNDITWNVLPLAVMSVYKYAGHNRQMSIAMSNVFRNCYLAHSIHASVRDDDEGQQYDQELHYNILIGDYVSGYILKNLVELNQESIVGEFAIMISKINQGMLIKHKLCGDYCEVIRTTRAPFYETAFLTAARLAGHDIKVCNLYNQMGFNLGMSIELGQSQEFRDRAQTYFHECETLFHKINRKNNNPNSNLEKAIKDLHYHFYNDVGESAVI
ncbi:MAG: hypothetical protein ACOX6E_05635 [Syntrophomonadaceae bacterium]|jgi:hypothetical protein